MAICVTVVLALFLVGCAGPKPAPTAAVPLAPTPTLTPTPTATPVPISRLGLIDAHSHVIPKTRALGTIIAPLMDQAGVTKIVLMLIQPQPNWPIGEDDKMTLEVYERNPQRVIPFLTVIRWGLSMRDPAWLEYAERQLATGKFRGLGQFIVKRYASHDIKDPGWDKSVGVPWDSRWAQNLLRLAAKHNTPILFTMETTEETLLALDRVLEQYPNVKVIWAHQNHLKEKIGATTELRALQDPKYVATLLEKHPNLFIDLSVGRDWSFRSASDRKIPEKWKDLYEKYNDRLVIGTDRSTDQSYQKGYVPEVSWIRSWLSELSSDTARKLAYENIERILSAKP